MNQPTYKEYLEYLSALNSPIPNYQKYNSCRRRWRSEARISKTLGQCLHVYQGAGVPVLEDHPI